MRKSLFILFSICVLNASAQVKGSDSIYVEVQKELKTSGILMQKSAQMQYLALGSGAICASSILISKEKSIKNKSPFNVFSVISGIAALVFEVRSIAYKMEAGRRIEITADKMIIRF